MVVDDGSHENHEESMTGEEDMVKVETVSTDEPVTGDHEDHHSPLS